MKVMNNKSQIIETIRSPAAQNFPHNKKNPPPKKGYFQLELEENDKSLILILWSINSGTPTLNLNSRSISTIQTGWENK